MGFRLKFAPMDSIGLIREFLKDRLGVEPDRVVPAAALAELGVDSLMMLELMGTSNNPRFSVNPAAQ